MKLYFQQSHPSLPRRPANAMSEVVDVRLIEHMSKPRRFLPRERVQQSQDNTTARSRLLREESNIPDHS